MSIRSQAELESQYHLRWAQVQNNESSPEQAFGNMQDWIVQLGERKALLHANLKQWMWYDQFHDYWVSAGCGVDEAILVTVGRVAGNVKLPQPEDVGEWCVYMQGEQLLGPLRSGELIDQFKSQAGLASIMVWSPISTGWLAVVRDGSEVSFRDKAGNKVSLTRKGEAAPTPAPVSLKPDRPQTVEAAQPAPENASISAEVTEVMSRPELFEIVVLSGGLENQRFPLGEQARLGREKDNELALPDAKASRHHAVIQRQGAGFQITDLKSGNGTFVNEKLILGPTLLKKDDIVRIGDTKFTISKK